MVAMHIGRASKGRTGAPTESERQACGLKGPDIKKEIDMEWSASRVTGKL